MSRKLFVALALLLSACTTTPRASESRWLVGTWLMMSEDIEHPLACSSGLPITYEANGTYRLFEESGTWRLDGARLIETATDISDAADEGTPELGRPYVSNIVRSGPNSFRKTFADGRTETFRRCPGA